MVCFLLSAFTFPLQMVSSGRRGLTSREVPKGLIGGGRVFISRVFVLDFRYKRQMLSTRVPKWCPFDVYLRIGAKVENMFPLERKPFWRPLRSPKNDYKNNAQKHIEKTYIFCKTWFKLDCKWCPRSLTILMLWCPKPPLEGRNDPQRFPKHSKWVSRVQKCTNCIKTPQNVVENWRAFHHISQYVSKWNL